MLIRLRLKTAVRTITHARPQQAWQYAFAALAGVGIFAFIFVVSRGLFRALGGVEGGEAFAEAALSGVYTLLAAALIFIGLATALYTLYLSIDLDLFASLPLAERTTLAYKYWETLFGNLWIFLVAALPILLAYGSATGASALYYPVLALVSLLVVMIPTGICVLLVMPLMRLMPAGRAKELVAALGAIVVALGYVGWIRLSEGGTNVGIGAGIEDILESISGSPALTLPPGTWSAQALTGAATLEWGRMLGGIAPLAAVAVAAYLLCLWLAGWAYATGRARATETGGRARSARWTPRLFAFLPPDIRAVVVKDLASLPRDLRRLSGAGVPVIMGFAFALFNPQSGALPAGLADLAPYLIIGAFAGLSAIWGTAQAVGGEGRAYGVLAALPLGTGRILAAKWISTLSLSVALAIVGCAVVSVVSGFSLLGFAGGLAVGATVGAVMALYAVGFAALFPRFDWENPNQALTLAGGLAVGACLLALMVLAGIAAGVTVLLDGSAPFWIAAAAGAGLWLFIAAGAGYAVISLGLASLSRMDWDL
ncbi:hypothetical protein BH24ACT16_BH24ACT16_15820 [soil metagenome]